MGFKDPVLAVAVALTSILAVRVCTQNITKAVGLTEVHYLFILNDMML